MTTLDQAARAATASPVSARAALRVGGVAAAVGVAGNLLVLLVGKTAGAELVVTQPGQDPMTIGVAAVVVSTAVAFALGILLLAATARLGLRAWTVLSWVGLAFGLLTVVAPFAAEATTGTALTLATMHLVGGLVWFVAVRRGRRA